MKLSSKWAATAVAATLSLTGISFTTTSYAATSQSSPSTARSNITMTTDAMKIQVTKVYPMSVTEISLDADKMALMNKTIMIKPLHKMGMTMSMTAKYDAMKGTFVLSNGNSLTPGVTYSVSASWAKIPMKDTSFTIPNLVKVTQISENKIELVYDRAVDTMSATEPGNYWIMSNQNMASGIAELGKNDMVTPSNGLTSSQVAITPVNTSKRHFIMTFTTNITPGVQYTVIPCSVDARGDMGYMGANFNAMSMNTITGEQSLM
jgi:hypothetical protein